jgi:hypothetical protein
MNRNPTYREEHLYQLWQRHAIPGVGFRCRAGERVVVVSSGRRNDSAGPDYLDAVLLIDGHVTVGDVEMHLSESDWFAHGHHCDRAYDRVILHLLGSKNRQHRLSLPTVHAGDLIGLESRREAASEESLQLSAELLADLSWSRLLRRVTEIIRTETELPAGPRLRRALLRRLFDCLGYSRNRLSMQSVAEMLLASEPVLAAASFDETAARVFAASGVSHEGVIAIGRGFMSDERLASIVERGDLPMQLLSWRHDTRPANAPERRLWAASKMVFDLYHSHLLRRLLEGLLARLPAEKLSLQLMPRFGSETFVGPERAREIVVNALLPVALAAGIMTKNTRVIESACRAYRLAPSLGSNRIIRGIERRYLAGSPLHGAFWQQGAIELYRRYLDSDRSGLSMIAERIPEYVRGQLL